jgi:hypothetical protein
MEASQFTFSQEVLGYAVTWEGYAYRVLGFSGSTVRQIFRRVVKM